MSHCPEQKFPLYWAGQKRFCGEGMTCAGWEGGYNLGRKARAGDPGQKGGMSWFLSAPCILDMSRSLHNDSLEVMKCQESPQEDFSLVTCKLFWFSKGFSWVLVEFDSFLCVCVYQLFRNCKRKQHSLCVLQIRGESTGDTLERSCFCCVFLTEGPEVLSP